MPDGPPDPKRIAAVEREYTSRGVAFVGPPLPVILAADDAAGGQTGD